MSDRSPCRPCPSPSPAPILASGTLNHTNAEESTKFYVRWQHALRKEVGPAQAAQWSTPTPRPHPHHTCRMLSNPNRVVFISRFNPKQALLRLLQPFGRCETLQIRDRAILLMLHLGSILVHPPTNSSAPWSCRTSSGNLPDVVVISVGAWYTLPEPEGPGSFAAHLQELEMAVLDSSKVGEKGI